MSGNVSRATRMRTVKQPIVDYSSDWVPSSSDKHVEPSPLIYRTSPEQARRFYSDSGSSSYTVDRWFFAGVPGRTYRVGYYMKDGVPQGTTHVSFLEAQVFPSNAQIPIAGFPDGVVITTSSWTKVEGLVTMPAGETGICMLVQSYHDAPYGPPYFETYIADWFVYEVDPTPSVIFVDTFTRSDGPAEDTDHPWYTPYMVNGRRMEIVSGRLAEPAGAGNVVHSAFLKLPGDEFDLTFDFKLGSGTNGSSGDLQVRMFFYDPTQDANAPPNYYMLAVGTSVNGYTLYRVPPTFVYFSGNGALTRGSTYTARLVCDGSTLKLYVGGVLKASETLYFTPSARQTTLHFLTDDDSNWFDNVNITAPAVQTVFDYTGAFQTFTVPAGVHSLTVESWGAQGSYPTTAAPVSSNYGGYIKSTVPVTSGEVLRIYVGGCQELISPGSGTGGFNGGGPGGTFSSNGLGGGGASDVRRTITLSDDFNRANGSLGAGWTTPHGGTWTVTSNQARMTAVPATGEPIAIYVGGDTFDVASVSALLTINTHPGASVIFNYLSPGNFFMWNIASGTSTLYKVTNHTAVVVALPAVSGTGTYRVDMISGGVALYKNGTFIQNVTSFLPHPGGFGVGIQSAVVNDNPVDDFTVSVRTRLTVAGGGGGTSHWLFPGYIAGGPGGAATGGTGQSGFFSSAGGTGGSQVAGGTGYANTTYPGNTSGPGGTIYGSNGTLGLGGFGYGIQSGGGQGAGGGGGGYYGGGGGSGEGAGGGGGSNYSSGTIITNAQSVRSGHGRVIITY